jgi:hypothetical protein
MYRAIVLSPFGPFFTGTRAGGIWHCKHRYTQPTCFPDAAVPRGRSLVTVLFGLERSFLKYVAVILFVLAAIFLFAVHSISTTTDLV